MFANTAHRSSCESLTALVPVLADFLKTRNNFLDLKHHQCFLWFRKPLISCVQLLLVSLFLNEICPIQRYIGRDSCITFTFIHRSKINLKNQHERIAGTRVKRANLEKRRRYREKITKKIGFLFLDKFYNKIHP